MFVQFSYLHDDGYVSVCLSLTAQIGVFVILCHELLVDVADGEGDDVCTE